MKAIWEDGPEVKTPTIEENISGIYAIQCLETSRYYIGRSTNIKSRIQRHLSLLKANKYSNYSNNLPILQADYNSGYNIGYTILEECPSRNLKKKEDEWIKTFHSLGRYLYNKNFLNNRTIVDCPTIYKTVIQTLINLLEKNTITADEIIDYINKPKHI